MKKIMDLYKKFACWIGWHCPISKLEWTEFDGVSGHCRCPWCGYEGLIDSWGNLF